MAWPIQQQSPNNQQFMNRGFQANNMDPMMYRNLPQQSGQGLLTPDRIGGLTQKLNNVQQVLKVVQTTAPIVQQYAPMVKNIPMMFKLMKALKESDGADDNLDEEMGEADNQLEVEEQETGETADEHEVQIETDNQINNESPGKSTPKLFI